MSVVNPITLWSQRYSVASMVEVPGSHAIYVSQPAAVASLIVQASNA